MSSIPFARLARVALFALLTAASASSAVSAQRLSAEQIGADELIGSFYYFATPGAADGEDRSFIATLDLASGEGMLLWQCRATELNVILDHGRVMVGDETNHVGVTYRFDEREASASVPWTLSRDTQASFIPVDAAAAFTEAGTGARTVELEVTDGLEDRSVQFRFSLTSLDSALTRLACSGR